MDLVAPSESLADLKAYASRLPSVQLSEREACDLELLATGACSPLDRFMGRDERQRVLDEMRLVSGHAFPIPVTLTVDRGPAIQLDRDIALRTKNDLLAVMKIEEIWEWDKVEVADKVFGTHDLRHPLVAEISRWERLAIAGRQTAHHWLPRLKRIRDERKKLPAALQLLAIVTRDARPTMVRVQFAKPITRKEAGSTEPRRVHKILMERMRCLLKRESNEGGGNDR